MSHFRGIGAPYKTLPVDNAMPIQDLCDYREDPANLSESLNGVDRIVRKERQCARKEDLTQTSD